MSFDYLLELITIVLLATTIVSCFVLHRRVAVRRDAQADMQRAVADFNAAAAKAEAGVRRLSEASDAAGLALQKEVDRARAMAEDLAVAVRSGDRIIARMAQAAEVRRG